MSEMIPPCVCVCVWAALQCTVTEEAPLHGANAKTVTLDISVRGQCWRSRYSLHAFDKITDWGGLSYMLPQKGYSARRSLCSSYCILLSKMKVLHRWMPFLPFCFLYITLLLNFGVKPHIQLSVQWLSLLAYINFIVCGKDSFFPLKVAASIIHSSWRQLHFYCVWLQNMQCLFEVISEPAAAKTRKFNSILFEGKRVGGSLRIIDYNRQRYCPTQVCSRVLRQPDGDRQFLQEMRL